MLSDSFNAAAVAGGQGRASVPTVPWNPWLGVLFAVAAYYVSQLFGVLVIYVYPAARHWSSSRAEQWVADSVVAQFVFMLAAEAFIIGAIYLFLKRYKKRFSIIGLRRPRATDFLYGILAVPAYFLIYALSVGVVSHFVPGFNADQQQQIGFNDVQGSVAMSLTFVSLVVLPPLAEEIMVRGFLYGTFKKVMPMMGAVLVTSAMFAAAHLPEGGADGPLYIAALDTFVLSLVLIYLREKTAGLWAPITLHAVKNGIAFLFLFVLHIK
jgi:membrane protease YdiL (CAAX protease family)